ncbi:hypothetical protein COCNU_07G015670 [Cocos nucifera]|uniref:Uncharacterized protein n=1 Tax=Cocos nucifera TaxID=13894 RepID=A0A8K0IGH1_COCNU|nr:hypothetical protein COCNU_07G015670 [Cocos nucifera]
MAEVGVVGGLGLNGAVAGLDLGQVVSFLKLIDRCTLPKVVDRIVDVDFELCIWDSLGSFLETGHQLVANIKMMNLLRSKVIKVKVDHRIEVSHLLKEKAEVKHLLKKTMAGVKDLQETVQATK